MKRLPVPFCSHLAELEYQGFNRQQGISYNSTVVLKRFFLFPKTTPKLDKEDEAATTVGLSQPTPTRKPTPKKQNQTKLNASTFFDFWNPLGRGTRGCCYYCCHRRYYHPSSTS